jgi:hypothetical protein
MCDVCNTEGVDWRFANGDKKLQKAAFYKVYVGQVASVSICHIHGIELFSLGERRFLQNHLPMAMKMASEKGNYSNNL